MFRHRIGPVLTTLAALGSLLTVGPGASADWPVYRHDRYRSGRATRRSGLARPQPSWRYYLGGGAAQMVPLDVDGDGASEVLFVSGGRLMVRRWDDAPVWTSAPLGIQAIAGMADVNGDGAIDIVAKGYPGLVAVFRARDGQLEWRTTPGLIGPTVGAVRVADLSGDGVPDVYLADAGCGSPANQGDTAYAFSFAGGFGTGRSDPGTELWRLEQGRDYACGNADLIADLDADGHPEIVAFSTSIGFVFDGRTGRKIRSGESSLFDGYALGFSIPYGVTTAGVSQLDAHAGDDLVAYTDNFYDPRINSRSVWAMSWDASRPPAQRFSVLWRHSVADVAADRHTFIHNGDVDLDGDGTREVVSTFTTGAGQISTNVYRGDDGTLITNLDGASVAGAVPFDSGRALLIVQRDTSLEGYTFQPSPFRSTRVFQIPDATVIENYDIARISRESASRVALFATGVPGHVRIAVARTAADRVEVWDATPDAASMFASFPLAGTRVVSMVAQTNVERPGSGYLLSLSNGVIVVTDEALTPLNLASGGVSLTGIRAGGYYTAACASPTTPVSSAVGRAAESVFVNDSRGVLVRLDPLGASIVRPPSVLWEWAGASAPTLTDLDHDGRRELIALTPVRSSTLQAVEARTADGARLWRSEDGAIGNQEIRYDPLPLGDATRESLVATSWVDTGTGQGFIRTLGPGGLEQTRTPLLTTAGSSQGMPVAFPFARDGVDTIAVDMIGRIRLFDALMGAEIASTQDVIFAEQPIVDAVSSGEPMILGTSIFSTKGLAVEPDPTGSRLGVRWSDTSLHASAYCGGAIAICPDGSRFGFPRLAGNRLVITDAATGTIRSDLSLAGGRAYAPDGVPVDAPVGVLNEVSASPALDGRNPAFVVGSSDGFLYAVDACSGTLLWANDFGAPVGQSIFADTDGDGDDELLVEAADGYLTALDTLVFPAPHSVLDTDPPHGLRDIDVDEICGDALFATWENVPDAIAYEWAVFDVEGHPISHGSDPSNPWIRTPVDNRVARWDEGLVVGSRYVFAVRAVGTAGTSAETLSDGVRYLGPCETPDAGVDAGDAQIDAGRDTGPDGLDVDYYRDASRPSDVCRTARCLLLEGRAGPIGHCTCRSAPGAASRSRAATFASVAALFLLAATRRRRSLE